MLLEINGQLVDLPAEAAGLVRLQKALAPLSDLASRGGEYSWSLTLPPTRRNATIFSAALLHPQALDKFVGSYTFRLRSESQEWGGRFLLSSLKSGYTGMLLAESFNFNVLFGEKLLPELATLRGIAGYDGSQLAAVLSQGPEATDIQFPLVSFGNYFTAPTTRLLPDGSTEEVAAPAAAVIGPEPLAYDDYPPSVYLLAVVRAIFREIGYVLLGPVLQDAEVQRWCITAAGSQADFWPWGSLLPAAATGGSQTHNSYYGSGPGGGFTNTAAGFDEAADVVYFAVSVPAYTSRPTRALDGPAASYTASAAGLYGFSWEAVVSAASQFIDRENTSGVPYWAGFAPVVLGLVVSRGGEGFEGADGGICTSGTGSFAPGQQRVVAYHRLDNVAANSFDMLPDAYAATASLYLEPGDTVRLLLFTRRVYSQTGDGVDRYKRTEFTVALSSAALSCTSFDGPTDLLAAAILPPLRQQDVVRDFLTRTNTVPVVDTQARTITLLSRDAHTQSQGEPVDLDSFCDPSTLEFLPVLDAAPAVVFRAAEDAEDAAGGAADSVTETLPGQRTGSQKVVESPFAAFGLRTYRLSDGTALTLPTAASREALDTPRSEASPLQDMNPRTARLVRYLGAHPTQTVAVGTGLVPWGQADYGGPLAWAGDAGAVASHYRALLSSAARGHVARISASLTPGRYRQLSPGRRCWLLGAEYTLESISGYDPETPAAASTLTLLRRV